MEEDFSNEIEEFFIEWCIARGFTLETPRKVLLEAIVGEIEQRIQKAEARGDQVIRMIRIDGSISFETIEEARETLKEFKRVFGLE